MRRLMAVVGCVGLLFGAAAASASTAPTPAPVFYGLNPDGSGWLFAAGASTEEWQWQSCGGAPKTTCAPFASGQSIQTGAAPDGTFFVATSSTGQIATSPIWDGTLSPDSPPRVFGSIAGNAQVVPAGGTWLGGWQMSGIDNYQLAACANSDGTDCTAITAPGYIYACPAWGAVIDPVFTGWYLRVADERYESDAPLPAVAIISSSAYGAPVWNAGPTTSVAVVGRIAPATGSRPVWCGGPPLPAGANPYHPAYECPRSHSLPGCPVATISSDGQADVWCGFSTCTPAIRLRRGQRSVTVKPLVQPRLPQSPSTAPVIARLSHSQRDRIGPGVVTETVYLRGVLLASKRVRVH